jgi:hypothetical protein
VKRVISHQHLSLEDLRIQGKGFKWEKPICTCQCPAVWGHGFVPRYFEGFPEPLWVRRFRCASCKTVFTKRPASHPAGIKTSILDICLILLVRFEVGRWKNSSFRQRNFYWLLKLLKLRYEKGFETLSHLRFCHQCCVNPFLQKYSRMDSS